MGMNYYPRVIDNIIHRSLQISGGIQLRGIKWCGKSTSAKRVAKTVIDLGDPDAAPGYRETADTAPSLLLKGRKPVLIDEWQDIPSIWDAVRTAIDRSGGEPGQFILTGSAVEDRKKIVHTGTGRIMKLDMHTMSLFESKESNGKVSLSALFNGNHDAEGALSDLTVPDLIYAACRGGFPQSLRLSKENALFIGSNYLNDVANDDISRVDGIERNPTIARKIIRSYARNIATLATDKSIIKDISGNGTISSQTYYDYINALRKLYVISDLEAWTPRIRSSTAIRSGTKRMIADPSISVAALGLSPSVLEKDLKTFGFIFESLVARDLLVYSTAAKGKLSYYHDRYGLEADFVLHLEDGRYALIELVNLYDDGLIFYFHGAAEGHKVDLYQKNPHVSFCVAEPAATIIEDNPACRSGQNYFSVIGRGVIERLSGTDRVKAMDSIMHHYMGDNGEFSWTYPEEVLDKMAFWALRVHELSAKTRQEMAFRK